MRSQPRQAKGPNKFQHYYLVSGKVMFIVGEPSEDNGAASTDMNCLLTSDNQMITFEKLSRAQNGLQLNLIQKINEPDIKFIDVTIHNIVHLGYMSEEQFRKETLAPAVEEVQLPSALQ